MSTETASKPYRVRLRRGPRRRLVEDRPDDRQGRRRRDRPCIRAVRDRRPARQRDAVARPPQRGRDVLRPRGRGHRPRRRRADRPRRRRLPASPRATSRTPTIVRSESARCSRRSAPQGSSSSSSSSASRSPTPSSRRRRSSRRCPRSSASSPATAAEILGPAALARRPVLSVESRLEGRSDVQQADVQQVGHARRRLPRDGDADARHRGRQHGAAAHRRATCTPA